jgi:hypothetical protein
MVTGRFSFNICRKDSTSIVVGDIAPPCMQLHTRYRDVAEVGNSSAHARHQPISCYATVFNRLLDSIACQLPFYDALFQAGHIPPLLCQEPQRLVGVNTIGAAAVGNRRLAGGQFAQPAL